MVIVCLVVLVPLIACVHSVEVLGLAWPVLVVPPIHLDAQDRSETQHIGGVGWGRQL